MNERIDTCAICLEELNIPSANICITQCSHVFHLNCFLRNREFNETCPMCRAHILAQTENNQNNENNDMMEIGEDQPDQPANFPLEQNVQQQVNLTDIHLLDRMIINNLNYFPLEVNDMFNFFEEIIIGSNINEEIRDILDYASNNDISNIDYDNDYTIHNIHTQILNLLNLFVNSTFNYLRHIPNEYMNINYNNINLDHYIRQYDLHNIIVDIIHHAVNNNIRNNMTYNTMMNNIYLLCKHFTMTVIFSTIPNRNHPHFIQNRFVRNV